MVHFILGISSLHGVSFGSTPHKPEWESVAIIFGSHIIFSFYKDFLHQLQEVQDGKRLKFNFDEEEDYAEFVPGEAVNIKLLIVDKDYIEIDDFDTDKKTYVKTIDLKILVEKNYVDIEVLGRQHRYFPLLTKQEYSGKSIKQLAKNYFEGSFSNVVSYLVKENNISVEELESLLVQIKKQQKPGK